MGRGGLFCLLLLTLCVVHESVGGKATPLKTSRRILDNVGQPQRDYEKELQTHMDNLWTKHTRDEVVAPSFFSDVFNSTIVGKTMETIHGRLLYAFQGFRYGKEPDINTRFKPPIPERKFWEGDAFNATHIGFKCPQGSMIGHNPSGEEDCLYLNVYTPYHPDEGKLLPVMFFIHGGAFTSGDASMYLPTKLLDYDVVLVTIHYRMGAFGFFTLDNEDAPGNTALYDMVEALRWNRDCIQDFGGDPDRVTIFGESAGSVSVNYMMLVEPARGLFHGVIAESGSALDHWAIDEDPMFAATYIADYLGCPTDDDQTLFDCVVKADAYDLVHAEGSLVSHDRHAGLMGFRGAAPTIQTTQLANDSSYELLVTQHPMQYFRERNFANVPFMTGANRQEGSFVLGIMYGDYLHYYGLDANATYLREQAVQDILQSLGFMDDTYALANSMTELYCPGIDLGNFDDAAPCIIDMAGVLFLKAGSWQTSNLHSYYSDQLTFYYSFEFESDDSMYVWLFGHEPPFDAGITHSDELMYLFSMPAVMETDNGQMKTAERMTKMWTNFAIYGHPTPDEELSALSSMGIPKWEPYHFEDPHFMLIEKDLTLKNDFMSRWQVTYHALYGDGSDVCDGVCVDIRDQRDAYEATMIVFIVAFVLAGLAGLYFFFKARN